MALVPIGVVPKRDSRTYSPGAMSVRASSELLASVTWVRAPAGRPFSGTVVLTSNPARTASFSVVAEGTIAFVT